MTADTSTDTTLVVPGSGEVVDLANPDEAAVVYDRLSQLARQLRDAQFIVRGALVEHAAAHGANTIRLPSAEVKVTHGDTILWDLDILEELVDAGLPKQRWQELVTTTIERKVSATVARQIANANPGYAAIIERAQTRHPKQPSVSVAMRADT